MSIQEIGNKAQIITDIRSKLKDVRDLPKLPTLAIEIQKIINDSNSSMSDLVAVVDKDMVLAGRILRIANSAFYGIPRKIDNLKTAMIVLGMSKIARLVTSVSVMGLFEDDAEFDMRQFWLHGAICGDFTVGLYRGLKLQCPNGAHISGLLHDIGKIILYKYLPEYYTQCKDYMKANDVRMVDAEIKLLGIDHGHIGSWLTRKWNVPDEISEAVAQHHIRSSDTPSYSLSVMVDWADRLSYIVLNRSKESVIELLESDQKWIEWQSEKGYSTERIVDILLELHKRSSQLIDFLR
ncbi:HDOD domain-containing protein [bacterium]|nr:HDOD domain-containing protein [bacterium]